MSLDANLRPQLAPGCRLGENQGQKVLLMPERALRLSQRALDFAP